MGTNSTKKAVSHRVVPSVFVIPGLLLAKEGQGRWFILPILVYWALYSSSVHNILFWPLRQKIKGIKHHHPPACIMLGLGAYLCCWGLIPSSSSLQEPMELDVTLVTISCFILQGRGETPQVQMRMQGRGACDSCVCVSQKFQVAVGLGAGGQVPPGCLSTEHSVLSLSVLATGRHEHI